MELHITLEKFKRFLTLLPCKTLFLGGAWWQPCLHLAIATVFMVPEQSRGWTFAASDEEKRRTSKRRRRKRRRGFMAGNGTQPPGRQQHGCWHHLPKEEEKRTFYLFSRLSIPRFSDDGSR